MYKIFPSEVQTFLKLYLSLASFNFFIRVTVKLSVIAIFFPFNFFLLSKIFFPSLYLTSLMIIGLGFSLAFLVFSIRCVLSISLSLISKFKCSFIALMHSLSVFSCFFSGISSHQKCHLMYLYLNLLSRVPHL